MQQEPEFQGRPGSYRVPKTAELIANEIRRRVATGQLQEGTALPPEAELMSQFGVSRPTLREAFRILESESLIVIRRGAHGGARIRLPTPEVASRSFGMLLQLRATTLADFWEARLLIEPPLAARLALRRTQADLKALKASLEEHTGCMDDPTRFAATSNHFHHLVVELAGNQTMALLVGMLDEITSDQSRRAVVDQAGKVDQEALNRTATRSHRKLYDLIEAGDAVAADALWRKHIESVGKATLPNLDGGATVLDLYK